MALTRREIANYYERWLRQPTRPLDDVYGRYSKGKAIAWRDCARKCAERNGYGLSIIGANCSFFSAGFTYEGATGKMFYVMTPSYDGEICVEDFQNEIL